MKYAYFIKMHYLEQENRTSNKIVAAKSFYHTFLHYIPNFQSVEQSITSFDIFKSDFLDF